MELKIIDGSTEEWTAILGHESKYKVSDLGTVNSLNYNHTGEERFLKQIIRNGYLVVNLHKDRKALHYRVNRLVALNFIPNPLNLPEVNHKDGNKLNNRKDNLEWVTSKGNKEHSVLNGLNARGEKNGKANLTENEVIKIRNSSLKNVELSVLFNTTPSLISRIKSRKLWKHI